MHRAIAAILIVFGVVASPMAARAVSPDDFVPRLGATHIDLFRVRAAVESGYGNRIQLSEFPLDGTRAAAALAAAGPALAHIPDADGLVAPTRSLRRPAPYFGESEIPVLITEPWRVDFRVADLFAGDSGIDPYADGDRLEEGVHLRASGGAAAPLADGLDVSVAVRVESGRTGSRLKVTDATVALRRWGMEGIAGRQARWWGPGTLIDVLLTNNALAIDGASFGSDGYQSLGPLGAFSARVFTGYLNDGDRRVPYPLLFGHRTVWQPRPWVEVGAGRTIMLGGGDRTRQLSLDVLWSIFLAKGENRVGYTGPDDTDQKASFDLQVYLYPLADRIPYLTGGRLFFQYGGDDSFDGFLPTTVAHHYGGSLQFPDTRIELEVFENHAFGLFYWHDEYRSGYTNHGLFLGADLGWDASSGRLRITRSLSEDWGLRLDVKRDARGHRFHQGDGNRPERGRDKTVAWEGGARLTRALGPRTRASISYHLRDTNGFTFDDDKLRARHVVRATLTVL